MVLSSQGLSQFVLYLYGIYGCKIDLIVNHFRICCDIAIASSLSVISIFGYDEVIVKAISWSQLCWVLEEV